MADTQKTMAEMFARFLNIELPGDVYEKVIPLLEKIEKSILEDLDLSTVQGKNTLKVLLSTLLTYGWGIGMHPFHNPETDLSNKLLEVRASKDILVPVKDMQAIRYLKKDKYGRVRKALFETDQNSRVRRQIDDLLGEITANKWQEEEF